MSGRPVVLHERARRDIDEAVAHYLAEAEPAVALVFIDALQGACSQIGEQPASGSLRYVHELDLPGLRFRTVRTFPYLVFDVEREAEVDVWRVLHEARDIPAWMREPCEELTGRRAGADQSRRYPFGGGGIEWNAAQAGQV